MAQAPHVFMYVTADKQWLDLLQAIAKQYGTIFDDNDVKKSRLTTNIGGSDQFLSQKHFISSIDLNCYSKMC